MAQVGNNENRLGGQYMVQDHDHMGEVGQTKDKTVRNSARQSDQSQSDNRQQGGDDNSAGKQQGTRRRQNH